MITRAQAEALLTLAASLEACEQLNLEIRTDYDGNQILQFDDTGGEIANIYGLTGVNLRLAVNALIPGGLFTDNLIQNRLPKQET